MGIFLPKRLKACTTSHDAVVVEELSFVFCSLPFLVHTFVLRQHDSSCTNMECKVVLLWSVAMEYPWSLRNFLWPCGLMWSSMFTLFTTSLWRMLFSGFTISHKRGLIWKSISAITSELSSWRQLNIQTYIYIIANGTSISFCFAVQSVYANTPSKNGSLVMFSTSEILVLKNAKSRHLQTGA